MSELSDKKSESKEPQVFPRYQAKEPVGTVASTVSTDAAAALADVLGALGAALSFTEKVGSDSIAFLKRLLDHVKAHHGNTPGV